MARVSHEAMKQALKGALRSGVSSSEVKNALRSAGVRLSSYTSDALKKHVSGEQVRKAFKVLRKEGMTKSGLDAGRFYDRVREADQSTVSHAKEMGKIYIKERAEEEKAARAAEASKDSKGAEVAKASKVVEVKAVTAARRGDATRSVSSPTTSVVTNRLVRSTTPAKSPATTTPPPPSRPPPDLAID